MLFLAWRFDLTFLRLLLFTLVFCFTACATSPTETTITWTDCGGEIGDRACDFTLIDQTGDKWNLYDHYGSIIILDFSAMWCGYCQKAAMIAQTVQNEFANHDVVWVTVLLQNNYGQSPTVQDLQTWSQEFDITDAPVVSGNNQLIDPSAQNGYDITSWPGFVIIDRTMTIAYELRGWNELQIQYWLQKMIFGESQSVRDER